MKNEQSFEDQMIQEMKNKVLKDVKNTSLIQENYNNRKPLPPAILDRLWGSIDWNEVIEEVRPEIQRRICNTIVASMETETKTDIKKLLSIDGVRQRLRMEVYPKLMKVLEDFE
jgi:hypothetical protein